MFVVLLIYASWGSSFFTAGKSFFVVGLAFFFCKVKEFCKGVGRLRPDHKLTFLQQLMSTKTGEAMTKMMKWNAAAIESMILECGLIVGLFGLDGLERRSQLYSLKKFAY